MSRSGAPRVLVVDNYDSFTYNLVQCLRALGAACEVQLSDQLSTASVLTSPPDGVLISPGPGSPEHAGVSVELVRALAGKLPILGVCLGHQVIALALGGRVVPASVPVHGKTSRIVHDGQGLFRGLPSYFDATRYHSLLVARQGLPDDLEVSAHTPDGEVMAVRHRRFALEGLQFHPESILTEHGPQLVQNWLVSL
jgi:anthranilate synthase/aminodeoxychorismate synthase-like glutamine amidotransferase